MEGFFAKYRSVPPVPDERDARAPTKERRQSPAQRAVFDDTTKCILCAACTSSCPSFWARPGYVGPAAIVERAPVHLRLAGRGRRGAARAPRGQRWRLEVPHDLQLRRRLPARHQHHPCHPGGLGGDRRGAHMMISDGVLDGGRATGCRDGPTIRVAWGCAPSGSPRHARPGRSSADDRLAADRALDCRRIRPTSAQWARRIVSLRPTSSADPSTFTCRRNFATVRSVFFSPPPPISDRQVGLDGERMVTQPVEPTAGALVRDFAAVGQGADQAERGLDRGRVA